MGVSGGLASIGLMPIIGTIALIIVGVAALAGAAWLLYRNWGAITGFFGGLWSEVKAGFTGGIAGVAATFVNFSPLGLLYMAFAPALRWLGFDMPARFSTFGRNMIAGLIGGITGMLGRLRDTIVGAASSAATWFKSKLGIRSPSRVFMGFGGFMMEGLDNGLAAGQAAPLKRMNRLGDGLSSQWEKTTAGLKLTPRVAAMTVAAGIALPAAPSVAARMPAPIAPDESLSVNDRAMMFTPRIDSLVEQLTAALTAGARDRDRSIATAPAAAPAMRSRQSTTAPASLATINIYPPAGTSPEDIGRAVADALDRRERDQARSESSSFSDPPDWI
jgi:hypothetical protein